MQVNMTYKGDAYFVDVTNSGKFNPAAADSPSPNSTNPPRSNHNDHQDRTS